MAACRTYSATRIPLLRHPMSNRLPSAVAITVALRGYPIGYLASNSVRGASAVTGDRSHRQDTTPRGAPLPSVRLANAPGYARDHRHVSMDTPSCSDRSRCRWYSSSGSTSQPRFSNAARRPSLFGHLWVWRGWGSYGRISCRFDRSPARRRYLRVCLYGRSIAPTMRYPYTRY